jgi:hypothetical protein
MGTHAGNKAQFYPPSSFEFPDNLAISQYPEEVGDFRHVATLSDRPSH